MILACNISKAFGLFWMVWDCSRTRLQSFYGGSRLVSDIASAKNADNAKLSLCYIYIAVTSHMYIYIGELVLVPRFSPSRARNSTTSRARNSTTSWGDHFRTTKNRVFWGFLWRILVPISVFLFCVLGPISELWLVIQHLSKMFFGNAVKQFRFFLTSVFKKTL